MSDSVYESLAGDAAAFQRDAGGEPVTITPYANGAALQAGSITATVIRYPLGTRATDGGERLEYPLEIVVPFSDYPDGLGGGDGRPNVKSDRVSLKARPGDATHSTRVVAAILGQAGGQWHLGIE